jgi:hypothetical protein
MWLVVPGIAWIIWQHRVHSNLTAFSTNRLPLGPRWAVAGWLIPVVNLAMPLFAMREVVTRTARLVEPVGLLARRGTLIAGVWWAAWLARIAALVAASALDDGGSIPLGRLRWEAAAWICGDVAILVGGAIGIVLILTLSQVQIDLFDRRRAEERAAWPQPAVAP